MAGNLDKLAMLCLNSFFPTVVCFLFVFVFPILGLFHFTYVSVLMQPAEIQLFLFFTHVCYQVRCWNEDLAGHCVDDK